MRTQTPWCWIPGHGKALEPAQQFGGPSLGGCCVSSSSSGEHGAQVQLLCARDPEVQSIQNKCLAGMSGTHFMSCTFFDMLPARVGRYSCDPFLASPCWREWDECLAGMSLGSS
eukprot:1153687-Pelagomonas_calceolata.AAC.2